MIPMRIFAARLSWIGLMLCLLACTNSGRSPSAIGAHEALELEILPNASKMFVYRMGHARGAAAAKAGTTGTAPMADIAAAERYRNGRRPETLREDKLRERAAALVLESGFCREGFLLLDRRLSPRNPWLRGECREAASDEDLRTFGARKILNAQAWHKITSP